MSVMHRPSLSCADLRACWGKNHLAGDGQSDGHLHRDVVGMAGPGPSLWPSCSSVASSIESLLAGIFGISGGRAAIWLPLCRVAVGRPRMSWVDVNRFDYFSGDSLLVEPVCLGWTSNSSITFGESRLVDPVCLGFGRPPVRLPLRRVVADRSGDVSSAPATHASPSIVDQQVTTLIGTAGKALIESSLSFFVLGTHVILLWVTTNPSVWPQKGNSL